jgi:hypothetical protein
MPDAENNQQAECRTPVHPTHPGYWNRAAITSIKEIMKYDPGYVLPLMSVFLSSYGRSKQG